MGTSNKSQRLQRLARFTSAVLAAALILALAGCGQPELEAPEYSITEEREDAGTGFEIVNVRAATQAREAEDLRLVAQDIAEAHEDADGVRASIESPEGELVATASFAHTDEGEAATGAPQDDYLFEVETEE